MRLLYSNYSVHYFPFLNEDGLMKESDLSGEHSRTRF